MRRERVDIMKRTARRGSSVFLSLAVLIVAGPTLAGILQDRSPFDGSWTANISKSKRHPNHLFKSATITFTVSADLVTLSYSGVNMSGVEEKGTSTFHPDGKEHSLEGLSGAVEVSRWVTPRILETVVRKDGTVLGQSTYEVSRDGKTLTARIKGTDASGTVFEQVIVCDR